MIVMARVEKTVFLSYRRTNFPWALAIYQHLTQHGFDVFFDYSGIASGDFESVILENIRSRAHFVVVLTPSALERCVDSGDWLRREIEEAMKCRRNIVPLMLEGFDFGALTIAAHLTGRLSALSRYNGVGVPVEYFDAAMEKLREQFLNVPLEAVLHPASGIAQVVARKQQTAASTDLLTGLVNRREFEGRMERALRSAEAHEAEYAVCYLDLDQFKIVNVSYGHSAGDALLVQVGNLLKSQMSWRDTVARLGGDEFGFLLENCSPSEAMRTAQTILEAVNNVNFTWNDSAISVSATIGVVPISGKNGDVSSVLNAAEIACQAGKEAGRNRVHSFAVSDIDLMRRRRNMEWIARVDSALHEDRFELFRQTIMPLQKKENGEHFEFLLRMRSETEELISPVQFMSAAEEHGISKKVDRWVIANAFRSLVTATTERKHLVMCSINVSGRSLDDEKLTPYVVDQLHRTGIDPTKICFEVSEPAAVQNFSQTSRFVSAMKELGFKFAIDHFGTGLSSFGYLKHVPVDFLKIDGSFVQDMLSDPIDREMVRSIHEIGHLTGKKTIALCADSRDTVDLLRSFGVDYAQGDGVSPPQSASNGPDSD